MVTHLVASRARYGGSSSNPPIHSSTHCQRTCGKEHVKGLPEAGQRRLRIAPRHKAERLFRSTFNGTATFTVIAALEFEVEENRSLRLDF